MLKQVESSDFDLRYESYRIKSKRDEMRLLNSIVENGIRDPLEGVDKKGKRILLNGFKRYRCAKKLGIEIVPYCSIGNDEADGIIEIIRLSNSKGLSILEQAKLIDELKTIHGMNNSGIATVLEKSKSWVSVRSGIIKEMSDSVITKIMNDEFPAYSYMYTIRQFMRINFIEKKEVEEFVNLVAGKNLSTRDIETLAHGYFKGSDEFRKQIKQGNISWGLKSLKEISSSSTNCTELERRILRDLEIVQKYMQKIVIISKDTRFENNSFNSQANILAGGIRRNMENFSNAVREFYDKSRETEGNIFSS